MADLTEYRQSLPPNAVAASITGGVLSQKTGGVGRRNGAKTNYGSRKLQNNTTDKYSKPQHNRMVFYD